MYLLVADHRDCPIAVVDCNGRWSVAAHMDFQPAGHSDSIGHSLIDYCSCHIAVKRSSVVNFDIKIVHESINIVWLTWRVMLTAIEARDCGYCFKSRDGPACTVNTVDQ